LPLRNDKIVQYRSITVRDRHGQPASELPDDKPILIEAEVMVRERTSDMYFGLIVQNSLGVEVLFADSRDIDNGFLSRLQPGQYVVSLTLPPVLAPGTYTVSLGIATTNLQQLDKRDMVCSFDLVNVSTQRTHRRPGILNLRIPWVLNGAKGVAWGNGSSVRDSPHIRDI